MSKSNHHKLSAQPRQHARSEETRRRILSAALEEAIRVGLHKVSMTTIAARAEVGVGMLNYHFGSRQNMLLELMSLETQKFWSQMALPRAGRCFFAYEAAIVGVYLEFLHANPKHMQLAEEIRRYEPELYQQGINDRLQGIIKRIKDGIDRGELPDMAVDEIHTRAHLIHGAYTFLGRLIEDEEYPGDEFVIGVVMKMLSHGFAVNCNSNVRKDKKE